jgi:hypothetical protein
VVLLVVILGSENVISCFVVNVEDVSVVLVFLVCLLMMILEDIFEVVLVGDEVLDWGLEVVEDQRLVARMLACLPARLTPRVNRSLNHLMQRLEDETRRILPLRA